MTKFGVACLVVMGLASPQWALAETHERQVAGGDLLYTATATATSEIEAQFRAQGQAIREVALECSLPPKGIRIFRQSASVTPAGIHEITVQAGLPLEDCERARAATKPEQRAALEDAQLAEELRAYSATLRTGRFPAPVEVVARPALPALHVVFPANAGKKWLEAHVDCRERMRRELRVADLAGGGEAMTHRHELNRVTVGCR